MRENYLYRGVKGMRDVFPEETWKYQALEQLAREWCERFGFGEIRTPLVEPTVLFERGIGQGTDIVNKEMFYVPAKEAEDNDAADKAAGDAGRRWVLRPEATASVARAYVEHEIAKSVPGVQRYFYAGPMFRYEKPQRGRLRQFTQIGVELFGSALPAADAEAILLLHEILRAYGALAGLKTEVVLEINSVGCPDCRPGYLRGLVDWAKPQAGRLCADCHGRLENNPLRLFDCKQPGCRTLLAQAPSIQDALCPVCRGHQEQVLDLLAGAEVRARVSPRLMRGLDYYTRTVFEFTSTELGAQNAVAAGGRYDGLVAELEGPPTPAVGWSLGVERLLELWDQAADQPAPLLAYVVDPGPDPRRAFLRVAALRRQGLSVGLDLEGKSPKALMKRADRLKVRFALFAAEHPDELQVRDMRTGVQFASRWDELAGRLRSESGA
ncbi:MAG: histidine--tRNA ligase [candidate division FCPU426 bacterium]